VHVVYRPPAKSRVRLLLLGERSNTVSVFWQIIMANWTDDERLDLRNACEAWMAADHTA